MATVKAYTDLNQSKKLAGILPPESADMCYYEYTSHIDGTPKVGYKEGITEGIPCWSAAALLEVLEGRNSLELGIKYNDGQYYLFYMDDWCSIIAETSYQSSLVDACYEMVLKLHELNLL